MASTMERNPDLGTVQAAVRIVTGPSNEDIGDTSLGDLSCCPVTSCDAEQAFSQNANMQISRSSLMCCS